MSLNGKPTCFDQQDSIPIIDYSLLTSATSDERSKAIQDLHNACKDWGCYMLVNHGIPENVSQEMLNASNEFFNLKREEKLEFEARGVFIPISYSTGFNPIEQKKHLISREALRLIVNPDFHCPRKPLGLSEAALDYVKRTRAVGLELIKCVSESLGFEASYMYEELNLDSGFQLLAINSYPLFHSSEIDTPRGLVPHSDHGVLTLLYENGVPGLEVLCNGEWISMSSVPNAFLVLNGDHIEIFSNGIYKRKVHRAVVSDERTRISLVCNYNPSIDTIVGPSPRLVDGENRPPRYLPMNFGEYLELQAKLGKERKDVFDQVRVM